MKIINYLLQTLGSTVKNIHIKNDLRTIPVQIVLLDRNTPIPADSICIGTIDEIAAVMKHYEIPKSVVFFAPLEEQAQSAAAPAVSLVETTLNLIPLYNKLNQALLSLRKAFPQGGSLESSFDVFFRNIVSRELSYEDEIKSGLYELPFQSAEAYNLFVIEASDPGRFQSAPEEIKADLRNAFPTSNVTLFSNRAVVMYHSPGRSIHLAVERQEALQSILEKYDAYAGISNHTRNFEMIRTEYLIAKRILSIARKMFPDSGKRIFTQEEYGTYFILDLCYRQYEQICHHDNVLYLTHPGLAALIRYDTEHNTNLREILLCYLLHDRNLTKTSQILFMHRNTTMNKINRIVEIVEDDLEDPLIRQRLLFSCRLYDYYEKYKQKSFKLLPVLETDGNKTP